MGRYHTNKTLWSDLYLIRLDMSYPHDFELFERICMARNMFSTYDLIFDENFGKNGRKYGFNVNHNFFVTNYDFLILLQRNERNSALI